MKKSFFAQIILLSLLIVAPNAYAASIIWQEQSTNYQAAESKFATISTEYPSVAADSKLVKSKELLFLATNLISEYQKLIKIEITESTSIKEEEKNSFSSLVNADISNMQTLSNSINGAANFPELVSRQTDINNSWSTIQAHKKYIQGILLIRKSEQALEKTNELMVKLQEKVGRLDASNPYIETINSEFESVKKDIEMASQTKDESLTLFNSISKDYASANTLYNEGRSKIRKAHIYIKQAVSVLSKVNAQVLDQQTSSTGININDFR